MADEEAEYESDPEEAKLSLKMRRKEASDDEEEEEEEEGGDGDEREREREKPLRGGIDSDGESDDQGGVAEYDDEGLGEEVEEEEEEEEEEEYYEEEEGDEEVGEYDQREVEIGGGVLAGQIDDEVVGEVVVEKEAEMDGDAIVLDQTEEEKKENEPFAVPTAGAFYMHDDRFRDNVGGRNRRTFGGRKLWESKDDKKWGHDKFEEMDIQERHFEEGRRSSRGYYRGRGRGRGTDHGYARGNRQRGYDGNDNQTVAPKTVRGRGPRRYQPLKNKNEAPSTQNKQLAKSYDKTTLAASGRKSVPTTIKESEPVAIKKVASSLSSASPPFYPSGSSNKDVSQIQKRGVQAGIANRNIRTPVPEDGFSMQQPNFLRGKNVIDSVGMDKLYIDNSASSATSKQVNNMNMSATSSPVISKQASHLRVHGRNFPLPSSTIFQPSLTHSHTNKVSSPSQVHAPIRNPVQSRNHPSLSTPSPHLGQHPANVPQGSPPKSSLSTIDTSELDSGLDSLESNKSKNILVTKGKGMVQGDGRTPFHYGGAQAIASGGNMGAAHSDQNFPATPAFLPVMQFGGQHPGGIGVPAVGMAFPGYVANPQLGLGNSEMTWLPVLAGAAGALGTTYPYITVDGAYHSRHTGQTSAIDASSKENGNKPSNEWKPQQRPEILSDESSQRQNKPRRYSEMKFDQ